MPVPPSTPRKLRILSGVQPSGKLHIGNYFGAMQQHIALQDEGSALYFIADYHALTTVQDPSRLAELVRDVALDYLALGLDPAKATFFRQSDVPEVCELTWLLATVTPMGLLERATSYKDKLARGIAPRSGLFFYPVLMAADILAYDSDLVPVGKDQVQHLEMARDMLEAFHAGYGCKVFRRPEARLAARAEVVPGTDGQKMSKSYGNTIDLFAEGKALKQVVMSIKTDSLGVDEPKDPETNSVFLLYRLVADAPAVEQMADALRRGGYGYGDAKKALLAAIDARFGPARERRRELAANPAAVEEILRDGGRRARLQAQLVLGRAREAVGMAGRRSRRERRVIIVLQRVSRASVTVAGEVVGEIGVGLCLLAGALRGDTLDDVRWLADKLADLRVFEDAAGRTNLALADVGGAVLLVPQFTLAADWRSGRRPSFTDAAPPDEARALLGELAARLRERGLVVREGLFGADMAVELLNAGPFTLVLDSRERPGPGSAGTRKST